MDGLTLGGRNPAERYFFAVQPENLMFHHGYEVKGYLLCIFWNGDALLELLAKAEVE